MKCEFCNMETGTASSCPNCGIVRYSAAAEIVYGATIKDSSNCKVSITDKYLIIRHATGGKRAANGFGLLGVAIHAVVDSASNDSYGYYPLNQIQRGIFPYLATGIKKKNAVKLINNDGSDFVLVFNEAGFTDSKTKVLSKMVENIRASIPFLEDGSNQINDVICYRPFVNKDTFDKIRPAEQQWDNWSYPQPQTSTPIPPMPQPVPQESKTVIATQPSKIELAPTVVSEKVEEYASSDFEESENQEEKICASCGAIVHPDGEFCSNCGTKYEPPKPKEKFCTNCGNKLQPEDNFCFKCGAKALPL